MFGPVVAHAKAAFGHVLTDIRFGFEDVDGEIGFVGFFVRPQGVAIRGCFFWSGNETMGAVVDVVLNVDFTFQLNGDYFMDFAEGTLT